MESVITAAYIAASILFILGLKKLSRQETARRGNQLSALGMLIAIVVTLPVPILYPIKNKPGPMADIPIKILFSNFLSFICLNFYP